MPTTDAGAWPPTRTATIDMMVKIAGSEVESAEVEGRMRRHFTELLLHRDEPESPANVERITFAPRLLASRNSALRHSV
jgi:hypothetical protein